MQHVSVWTSIVAALFLTAASSDSPSLRAPVVLATIPADVAITECQTELNALRGLIEGAEFTGKNAATDEARLLLKVDAAEAKLAEDKTGDALQKLDDIRVTVVALSTPDAKGKTKLDAAGAAAIIAAVNAAEVCIQIQGAPPA